MKFSGGWLWSSSMLGRGLYRMVKWEVVERNKSLVREEKLAPTGLARSLTGDYNLKLLLYKNKNHCVNVRGPTRLNIPLLLQDVQVLLGGYPNHCVHNRDPVIHNIQSSITLHHKIQHQLAVIITQSLNKIVLKCGCLNCQPLTPVGDTHRIVLKSRHIGLNCSLHVPRGHQSCCQVNVSIDEVRFETKGMTVVLDSLLQLSSFLEDIAQVGIRLSQHWVLLNGQSAEVGRPARQENIDCNRLRWHIFKPHHAWACLFQAGQGTVSVRVYPAVCNNNQQPLDTLSNSLQQLFDIFSLTTNELRAQHPLQWSRL